MPSSKTESVDGDTIEVIRERSRSEPSDDGLDSVRVAAIKGEPTGSHSTSPSLQPLKVKASRSSSTSSAASKVTSNSSLDKKDVDDKVAVPSSKMELEEPVKATRSASQKAVRRHQPLVEDLPDATSEAETSFVVIESCTYANKFLGYTEHAMECDCAEEWGELSTAQASLEMTERQCF